MYKTCFEPIYNEQSKILILGSIPSIKSLEENFYYMHPQNQFWKLLDAIFYNDHPTFVVAIENYRREKSKQNRDAIKELLAKNNIALYDVINSCKGKGSLDNKIEQKSIKTNKNEIQKILNITKKIYLNGGKAYTIFIKLFPNLASTAVKLPSSSPANTIGFYKKLDIWKQIKY